MAPEHGQKGVGFVIGPALKVHRPINVMEKGKHIQGPITDILELFESFTHGVGLQIRRKSLEDLNARTLVKEDQMLWWIAV
jgi:hypothetical protein